MYRDRSVWEWPTEKSYISYDGEMQEYQAARWAGIALDRWESVPLDKQIAYIAAYLTEMQAEAVAAKNPVKKPGR